MAAVLSELPPSLLLLLAVLLLLLSVLAWPSAEPPELPLSGAEGVAELEPLPLVPASAEVERSPAVGVPVPAYSTTLPLASSFFAN